MFYGIYFLHSVCENSVSYFKRTARHKTKLNLVIVMVINDYNGKSPQNEVKNVRNIM